MLCLPIGEPSDHQAVPGERMIPVPGVDEEVIVGHCLPGEDLWDLARIHAPEAWAGRWVERVLELNGWRAVPVHIEPGKDILLPDWRPTEPDVWGVRPPMAEPGVRPARQSTEP